MEAADVSSRVTRPEFETPAGRTPTNSKLEIEILATCGFSIVEVQRHASAESIVLLRK